MKNARPSIVPAGLCTLLLILTLGCAAFFFCIVYLGVKCMVTVARSLFCFLTGGSPGRRCTAGPHGGPVRICPRPQCRKVERRSARFCGQCGARLSDGPDHATT